MSEAKDPLRAWLGDEEAAAFARVAKVAGPLFKLTTVGRGPRFGNVRVAAPVEVKELTDPYRPGLLAWAHEGAGDDFVWDLRRGRPARGAPIVLHVDHEVGMATPFAKNIASALVLFLLYELLGLPGSEVASQIARWRSGVFAGAIDAEGAAVLDACAARGRARPSEVPLPDERALWRAARSLRPTSTKEIVAALPQTWFALLKPDDRDCLAATARDYVDAVAGWRELVFDEGHSRYRWHLAATLRGAADINLRLGRFTKAGLAAEEAVQLYEPLHEARDARVTNGLAFVHRALAVVRAREKKYAEAHRHGVRALELYEESLLDASLMLDALDRAVTASLCELGGDADGVRTNSRLASERSERFRTASPPHPYAPQAERVKALSLGRQRTPRKRR